MPEDLLRVLDLNVERGVDIDCQNTNGDTALHDAATRGMLELTRYLLEKGANPNILNLVGETALHKAVQCRFSPAASLAIVKLLVKNGADVSACGLTGSPLSIALMYSNEDVAKYLKKCKNSIVESGDYRVHATKRYGPSYENIDMATLLGIRQSSSTGGAIVASQKPGPDDIVEYMDGFNFELGLPIEVVDDLADLKVDDDITTLDYKGKESSDYVNILGVYRTPQVNTTRKLLAEPNGRRYSDAGTSPTNSKEVPRSPSPPSPSTAPGTPLSARDPPPSHASKNHVDEKHLARRLFCISILKQNDNGKMPGIIRTSSGDHRFYIPVSAFPKEKSVQSISAKDMLKELQKEIPELDQKGICRCVIVDNPELHDQLANFEKTKTLQASRMKIGVLYAKKGQTTESEILGNEHGSEEFEEFLQLLGDTIELKGWEGFKGDLDVKNNMTGTKSLFTTFRKTDIMFHVSTYLPHSVDDEQQIARKRCIGNDLSTIIYLEEGAVFKPPCVSGDFLHIFAAVQPATTKEGKPGYRVAFSSRDGVPSYGPIIPKPAIFGSEGGYLRDFLLTKLINGERAALHSEFLIRKMTKTRTGYLEELINTFAKELVD